MWFSRYFQVLSGHVVFLLGLAQQSSGHRWMSLFVLLPSVFLLGSLIFECIRKAISFDSSFEFLHRQRMFIVFMFFRLQVDIK